MNLNLVPWLDYSGINLYIAPPYWQAHINNLLLGIDCIFLDCPSAVAPP